LAFRFSEKLSTNANVNLSFYDTEDVNFKTFEAAMGLQYMINSWLSAALNYRFSWIDSGSGANQGGSSGTNQTDLLNKGIVNSNSVFLVLTGRFDLWPNIGLARGLSSTTLNPVLKTPFPLPAIKPSNIP
jgi:opacity protein-like surface antigen